MDARHSAHVKDAVHTRNTSSQSTIPTSSSSSSFEYNSLSAPDHRRPYARTPSFEPPSFFAPNGGGGSAGSESGASSHPGRAGTLAVDLGSGALPRPDKLSPTSRRLRNAEAGRATGSGSPAGTGSGRNRWWPDGAAPAPRTSYASHHHGGGRNSLVASDTVPISLADSRAVGAGATACGNSDGNDNGGVAYRAGMGLHSAGGLTAGYTSSAEGDPCFNAASQLASRTWTPRTGVSLADRAGALVGDTTESEVSEYDEHARLKHGSRGTDTPKATSTSAPTLASAGAMLGALGKSLAGEGFWSASGSSSHGAVGATSSTARARNAKRGKWVKPRTGNGNGNGSSDRGWLLNSSGPSARLRTRRPNAALTHPLRMAASFFSKLFRTFFGPIHPVTILVALVLIASFVASVTKLIIYILNPDKEPVPWRTYCQQQPPFPHAYADALAPVDVFVGIFSVDSSYERRHLIRSTYGAHTVPLNPQTGQPMGNVQVRFIIGRPRKAHARRVALEMEVYNDLVILDMEENMNRGKTHAFFKWAAENASVPFLRPVDPSSTPSPSQQPWQPASVQLKGGFGQTREVVRDGGEGEQQRYEVAWKKVDYVVKADDDAFIVLEELERHLRVSPRQMTYWGYLIRNWFMGGECYALSSDLVQYVATSENVLHYIRGKEDKKVAQWINLHPNRASINWVSEHCWIYDHPKAGTAYSHGFLFPDHVEKIKLEGRRGLSDQEVARRGGEHRAKSFSTVRRWHQAYTEPRGDLTVEEEVEALVEDGGRWAGTWMRGEEGNDTQVWVPREQIVFEANDDRLKSPLALNIAVHAALAEEVQFDPETGLAIRRTRSSGLFSRSDASLVKQRKRGSALDGDHDLRARDGRLMPKLASLPRLGDLPSFCGGGGGGTDDPREQKRAYAIRSAQPRLIPLPSHKEGNGEAEALRAKRYLGRRYGGTVVVHFLKKSEWFYETALAFAGRSKSWTDGAGGAGTEWRMYGSPLVRHEDGYVSDGRSQPHPDVEIAYLQTVRVQAQANAALAQGQAARVGSFTKPRSPSKQGAASQPPPPPPQEPC